MRWDNSKTDIVNFFRKLRENQKLTDVTLVTDEGQHIQAHKIILAAASLFFEDVFMKSNHTNMLVYLQGIGSCELEHVLNFVYTGEVVVSKKELKDFLQTAKKLKVKGLDYKDTNILTQIVNDYDDEVKKESVETSVVDLVEVSYNVNNAESGSNNDNSQQTTFLEHEKRAGFDNSQEKENKSLIKTCMESVKVTKNEEIDAQVEQMIVKKDGLWECTICGKTTLYISHMREHTETHIDGISHACHICSKTFSSRHTLRNHISGIHSELFTCDVCGKSGMNKHAYRAHQRRQHKLFSAKH